MRCYYEPDYFLPLPEGHPFPMEKFAQARELLDGKVEIIAPPDSAREQIELVHDPDYLDAVSYDSLLGPPHGLRSEARARLGLPANPLLLTRSMRETSGTIAATYDALLYGLAANLGGGTHHAFPDRGLGYCVLNDIAVAIACLRQSHHALQQILIVDTDAHQGNGNHACFANDPAVFTYSIHVGANYPAHKIAGDCDQPLPRFVSGNDYLSCLEATLPDIFRRCEPDLVFWISGADCHANDRFGQMQLSTAEMAERDHRVMQLCRDYCAATVVVFGGGYNREPGMTAALHAQSISITAIYQ